MAKKAPFAEMVDSGLIKPGSAEDWTIRRTSSGLAQLDDILGGGYAFGKNVLLVGPESTGKTILAQYAVAAVQSLDPENQALLVDAEMSLDRDWWAKSGVDLDRLLVLQPPTGEVAVDAIIAACSDKKVKIIVVDSIAALAPTAIIEKAAGERTVASLSNLVSNLYTRLLPANKHAVFIAINQLRDNMNGYDDRFPGGRILNHDSHVIIRTRRDGWIKDGETIIGYVMEIFVRKNKLGSPQAETKVAFLYDSQIDLLIGVIDQAIEKGIIEGRTAWYYWHGEKFLGKGNLRAYFRENGPAREELEAEVKAAITA